MASGYGYNGGSSRCLALLRILAGVLKTVTGKCYAQADVPKQCAPQAEDYLECLHHTKEIARAKEIKAEFIRKAEHQANEGRKAADILADGVIVGVGLIQRGEAAKSK
ncbi:hypothetical protein ONZ51_g3110 [Trametes cubensis]|uniref:NADH dehydrogenase [ubiquinone] iron-sulfur protein 5 n=1 Tax=Trametes cubensis TaxID=1111947 RepID=A0AAD7XE84_9APHY|nr:hypothetical protein ONZ51_g3110 [Trametes cubensis]